MKKIIAMGLVGALTAASIVGGTTTSAQAGNGGAFVAGVLIGAGVAALIHHYHAFGGNRELAYNPGYPVNSHVAWCKQRYLTYKASTDTFTGFDGLEHRCVAPY
jgi:hypothetical protein